MAGISDYLQQGGIPYWDIFQQEAAKYQGLTPELLAAQAYQESHFNPGAKGAAGEMGMTQFMPGTWNMVAKPMGLNNPYDPTQAIKAQAKLMGDYMAKYKDPAKALWAYNAGEGNLQNGILPNSTKAYQSAILNSMGMLPQQAPMSGMGGLEDLISLWSILSPFLNQPAWLWGRPLYGINQAPPVDLPAPFGRAFNPIKG